MWDLQGFWGAVIALIVVTGLVVMVWRFTAQGPPPQHKFTDEEVARMECVMGQVVSVCITVRDTNGELQEIIVPDGMTIPPRGALTPMLVSKKDGQLRHWTLPVAIYPWESPIGPC